MEYENRFRQAQRQKYDCLLFGKTKKKKHYLHNWKLLIVMILTCLCVADLDDTLYPLSCGIAKACGQNIKGNNYETDTTSNIF